jgi:hypothetical protein
MMGAVTESSDGVYLEERIVELDDLGGKDLGLRLASKR